MKVRFQKSFLKDLKRISTPRIKPRIVELIGIVKKAEHPDDIPGLAKLIHQHIELELATTDSASFLIKMK